MNIQRTRTAAAVVVILLLVAAVIAVTGSRPYLVAAPEPAAALTITCEVKHPGDDEWSRQIAANDGDTVRWRVHVKNDGDAAVSNLCVRDILPTGMTYVPGSTSIANSANPDGIAVSDRIVTDAGINIGTYDPGGGAWIYFDATVERGALDAGGNVILRNVAQTSGGSATGTVEASADVIVAA